MQYRHLSRIYNPAAKNNIQIKLETILEIGYTSKTAALIQLFMDNQQVQVNQQQTLEVALTKNLIAAVQQGKKNEISKNLRQYKTQEGLIKYEAVLSIPTAQRIAKLAVNDFDSISMAITVALTLALEGMNLKRGMNAIQIVDLSELIIDSAGEDDLAFEDLMLFLQKLVRGHYGTNYESMDLPKFMEKFEIYREERHQELHRIIYERHDQYKTMGDTGRTSKRTELDEHFYSMASRMSELNHQLKETRQENRDLKK